MTCTLRQTAGTLVSKLILPANLLLLANRIFLVNLVLLANFGPIANFARSAENWPEFRGPSADGHSDAKGLPLEWNEEKNIVWKTPVHGKGWSTPVIWGSQVWVTTATEDGKKMSVLCLDRVTGKILHDSVLFNVASPRPLGNTLNCYASPSPNIEEGRVYLNFGSYGTACLDTSSFKTLWERRDLPCNHFRGPASSPILYGGRLIFHMDGSDYYYVVALDTKTGRTAWKTDRSTDYGDLDASGQPKLAGDLRKAYNTPIIVGNGDDALMISPAAKAVYGYRPADGKEIWQIRYPGHSTASRALYYDGMAFVNTGYSKAQLWAVRIDGKGDVTKSHVAWKRKKGIPNRSSPIVKDGRLYMVTDKGVASCLDAKSGEEVWVDRIGGNFSASLLCAEGRIYLCSHEGVTTVIAAEPKFRKLAQNKLDGGFMSSPTVAGKALYLRTKTHVYRIEKR